MATVLNNYRCFIDVGPYFNSRLTFSILVMKNISLFMLHHKTNSHTLLLFQREVTTAIITVIFLKNFSKLPTQIPTQSPVKKWVLRQPSKLREVEF